MGAPHGHRAPAQGARGRHRPVGRRPDPRRAQLALHRRRVHRPGQRLRRSSARPTTRPTPTTTGASASRCCGTRRPGASSTTSRATSCGCSAPASATWRPTTSTSTRPSTARRSTRSTRASTRRSTTPSTSPASRRDQEFYEDTVARMFATLDELDERLADAPLPVRRRARRDRLAPVHDARALRRRLQHPLQVQPAADRRPTRTCGRTRATSTSCPGSPRRSASTRSARTTTARIRRSTRAGSSPSGRPPTGTRRTGVSGWPRASARPPDEPPGCGNPDRRLAGPPPAILRVARSEGDRCPGTLRP